MKKVSNIINVSRSFFIITAGLLLAMTGILSAQAAGSATMSLTPASGSYQNGSMITVSVYENSGSEQVNAVQANLSYPDNLLDFVDISSSSAFPIAAESSGSNGSVKIGRGTLTPVTGNQLVATVRFTAAAGSGTAAITFAGGSQVVAVNGNQNILSGTSGASYTLTGDTSPPPPTPPPSGGGSSSGGSSTPKPSGSSTPPASKPSQPQTGNTTTPVGNTQAVGVSDVTVTDITANTATVKWKTTVPASSEVLYGLDGIYALSAISDGLKTDHSVALDPKQLVSGKAYNYKVKSTDAAGNTAYSPDAKFRTKGVTLTITVKDEDKKAVQGASVTIDGVTAKTDENGQASLADLPAGQLKAKIEYKGKTTEKTVEVKPAESGGQVQGASIDIITEDGLPAGLIAGAAAGVLLLVGGASLIHIMRKRAAASAELARHIAVPVSGLESSGSKPDSNIISPTDKTNP